MSELPSFWTVTTLSEVGVITTGTTPSTKEPAFYDGITPFVKPGDLDQANAIFRTKQSLSQQGVQQARLLRAGAVLVSCIGNLGKVGIAGVPLVTNQQINAIEFDSSLVQDRYGYFYCKTLQSWMEQEASATTISILNKSRFASAPFILAPFNEQKRIADKLDQLFAAIDSCKTHLDTIPGIIKRFRQSVLAAATSGELTADWREENTNSFDWSEVVLEDVAEDFSYGTSAKSSKEGTVPVLRMGNIQSGNLDWNDLVFTSDAAEIKKYALLAGDVLFNRTNSPELVGKTAVYKGEKRAIFAGYLIRVRCSEKLLPDFLNYCLNCPDGKTYCWQVKTDGVSQSNINAKKLAALPFLLPPINEQHEIVRRVEALLAVADRLEARYQAARAQVDQLTPSLLAKAFCGELVPQEPNDEPASILLARIKSSQTENKNIRTKTIQNKKSTPLENKSNHGVIMLQRKDIQPSHLSSILKARGPLTAEKLWSASQLDIDDFYDQLKDEDKLGLLKERIGSISDDSRLLEAS